MSLFIECGEAGGGAPSINYGVEKGEPIWSEALATAGTSSNAVPDRGAAYGAQHTYLLTLTADVDMYVAIGTAPNAAANPRRRMKAGTSRTFSARAGHKVAWAAA